MKPRLRLVSIFCFAFYTALTAAPPVVAAEDKITFEQHIRPIFKVYCLDCHGGGEKIKGKLDLRLRRFAVRGGKSGPDSQRVAPGSDRRMRSVPRS